MKTRNLLSVIPLLLLSLIGSSKKSRPGGSAPNGYMGGGSPIFIPRRGKLKGWQKENRKYRTNRTK